MTTLVFIAENESWRTEAMRAVTCQAPHLLGNQSYLNFCWQYLKRHGVQPKDDADTRPCDTNPPEAS
jgi:hypothetical protein